MSARPTLITDEIYEYLVKRFNVEDEYLKNLKKNALALGIPEICISPEQGKFLQFFLKSISAKYVLEIGSLFGYSAVVMAEALPADGKVICLEVFKKNADFISESIKGTKYENKIEVINGDASAFLKTYKPEFELDFVFIDADKGNYSNYMNLTTPMLRKGGILCADNALAFGHVADVNPKNEPGNVKAIQAFNENLLANPLYFSSLVTMGDGMAIGIKI